MAERMSPPRGRLGPSPNARGDDVERPGARAASNDELWRAGAPRLVMGKWRSPAEAAWSPRWRVPQNAPKRQHRPRPPILLAPEAQYRPLPERRP